MIRCLNDMKRFLLIIGFILPCLVLRAQDYRIISVEHLPHDMSAREYIKEDERGRKCAVFRIATQNISPEMRKGFHFECDYASYVVENTIVDGEIWLWISPGVKTLKVAHRDWGKLELAVTKYLPEVESLHTYKIVILGTVIEKEIVTAEQTTQFLVFNVKPKDAVVTVNGEQWPLSDGIAQKAVEFGKYGYQIEAEDYIPVSDSAEVVDAENMVLKEISLKPIEYRSNFVTLNAAYSPMPQMSYGFAFGSVKRVGWFVTAMYNFDVRALHPDLMTDENNLVDGEYPSFSGRTCDTRISAMAGMIVKLGGSVCFRMGAGYGVRVKCGYTNDNMLVRISQDSFTGVDATAGIQLNFKGFTVSADAVTTNMQTIEAKVGVGYCWRTKTKSAK